MYLFQFLKTKIPIIQPPQELSNKKQIKRRIVIIKKKSRRAKLAPVQNV